MSEKRQPQIPREKRNFRNPAYVKRAHNALQRFDRLAKNLGLKPFLMTGTCLGFVRDKKFIACDNEVDVGVISTFEQLALTESEYLTLAEKMRQNGFVLHQHYVTMANKKRAKRKTLGVDQILFRIPSIRHVYWHLHGIKPSLDLYWKFRPFLTRLLKTYKKFDTVTYKGRVYNVPHPVEEYLKIWYGNWRVPRKVRRSKSWIEKMRKSGRIVSSYFT